MSEENETILQKLSLIKIRLYIIEKYSIVGSYKISIVFWNIF